MPLPQAADVPKPTLIIIGADPFLRERIGAFSLPFELRCRSLPPVDRRFGEAILVGFPEQSGILARLPRRYPAIGFGSVSYMAEAFERGVADYLADPWSMEEFSLRIGRVLGLGDLEIGSTGLSLRGSVLRGPGGAIAVPFEQAALLRQLILAEGSGLSRNALRRYLWPSLGMTSRAVDAAVSRLRRKLVAVSGKTSMVQLRAVRGFGYSLATIDPL